jgi:hypothetical protein
VVLDNAPLHTSAAFKAKQVEWEQKGLYLFFLPKYSPHLNRIERLWKQIKHGWLKAQDYLSLEHLRQALSNILTGFGTAFTLDFKELDLAEIDLTQFPIFILIDYLFLRPLFFSTLSSGKRRCRTNMLRPNPVDPLIL